MLHLTTISNGHGILLARANGFVSPAFIQTGM